MSDDSDFERPESDIEYTLRRIENHVREINQRVDRMPSTALMVGLVVGIFAVAGLIIAGLLG